MATETNTFYPGAYDQSKSSTSSITNATNPVGKGSSNTSYASISAHRSSVYAFWPFDVSVIPSSATIDSVVCKAKAKITSTSKCSGNLQLYSGTTAKGSSTSLTTSATAKNLTCGTWTRDELGSICLRTYIYANSPSTDYLYFYGADLTVTYTYNSQKFMLKLGGSWDGSSNVYKKVDGIWVEKTELSGVIEDGVRYRNGGQYVKPTKTVTITGEGWIFNGEPLLVVIINGVTYTQPATVEIDAGTVIQVGSAGYVYLNGVVVGNGSVYSHTVNENCTINLEVDYNTHSIKASITTQ